MWMPPEHRDRDAVRTVRGVLGLASTSKAVRSALAGAGPEPDDFLPGTQRNLLSRLWHTFGRPDPDPDSMQRLTVGERLKRFL